MKAWIIENTSSDYWGDDWNEIVFADNYREAKKKATYTSLFNGDYLNLRVKRYPAMDNTEILNHKDYTFRLWLSGWMWEGGKYPLDPYDLYDDKRKARIDFLKWYSKYYGSESNEID